MSLDEHPLEVVDLLAEQSRTSMAIGSNITALTPLVVITPRIA